MLGRRNGSPGFLRPQVIWRVQVLGGDTRGDGGEEQRKEQREDMRGELNHGTLELVKYSE